MLCLENFYSQNEKIRRGGCKVGIILTYYLINVDYNIAHTAPLYRVPRVVFLFTSSSGWGLSSAAARGVGGPVTLAAVDLVAAARCQEL